MRFFRRISTSGHSHLQLASQLLQLFSSRRHNYALTTHMQSNLILNRLNTPQCLIPTSLQLGRDQPVLRVCRIVLSLGAARAVSRGLV
jgi:hypothetical protein